MPSQATWNVSTQSWELVYTASAPDTEEGEPPLVDCECEGCKLKKGDPVKIRARRVGAYNAKPRGGWEPRAMLGDQMKYMMGVELETDNDNNRHRYTTQYVSNEQASGMGKPKDFWLPKHDGSVSGPEFASHPATLTWWNQHRDDMEVMFRMLVHAGFRSHDGGNAGMHVNIGKGAFEGSVKHLSRFISLVNRGPQWSRIMAQRTQSQESQWARIDQTIATSRYDLESLAANILNGYHATYKYSALNAPQNESRIEFRLPRGTLRVDRFYKNLFWTQSMIEFTRKLRSINTATPTRFMQWVEDNAALYPDLSAFMTEKRVPLVAAATRGM